VGVLETGGDPRADQGDERRVEAMALIGTHQRSQISTVNERRRE